ncbi:MAG TPA: hypothetical protein DCR58_00520 [Idiomarina baltica]|uniref:Uncharacterized protein n=1 Tax=Idiomarina baltica TaxID=190892 RepID=A0A348WL33_9GAMM|nr:hypothetical protein [Alteromonas macleodii]MAD10370.1 hypothetical protein [Alteromonas sp.]HAI70798.1 hypothetical protein [Alteromonas australica]HAR55245.1 hypothetical protein [Idiomarina baltica]|tara:strand:+ start:708 stop:887 length:180 start_codon:yes stop_codon:yes gene_type:complete
MSQVDLYQPTFDAQTVLKKAVEREFRRKKALGQYVIVGENSKPKKIDFSILKTSEKPIV